MHNFANTGLIIENCILTDSVGVILHGRIVIITRKGQSWVHGNVKEIF